MLICALTAFILMMDTAMTINWEKKELVELLLEFDELEQCKDKKYYCFCDYFYGIGRTTGLCCDDDTECHCCATMVMERDIANTSYCSFNECPFQCVYLQGVKASRLCCPEDYQITCDSAVPRRARMFRDKAIREQKYECPNNMAKIYVARLRSNFKDFNIECPKDTYWEPRVRRPKKPKKNAGIAVSSATAAIALVLFVKSVLHQLM